MEMISVVIVFYNERSVLSDCLFSISEQSISKRIELILVDDGSDDNSLEKAKEMMQKLGNRLKNIIFISQTHQGPAKARNLGAKAASGEVLVFIDADMTFDGKFIENLVKPIYEGKLKGTFTKEEYVSNWDNVWARCWNYNQGIGDSRRIPSDYPDNSPVFRALKKSEFERAGGFDNIGFTDDWTLSRKLGYKAGIAENAVCYHKNPSTLNEVYIQARWIGKNEFISGNILRRIVSLLRFNFIIQSIRGIFIILIYRELRFLIFALVYYCGIYVSICRSFAGEAKYK